MYKKLFLSLLFSSLLLVFVSQNAHAQGVISERAECNYVLPAKAVRVKERFSANWRTVGRGRADAANFLFTLEDTSDNPNGIGNGFYWDLGPLFGYYIPEPYHAQWFLHVQTGAGWRRFLVWQSEGDPTRAYIFGYRDDGSNHGCGTWAPPMTDWLNFLNLSGV